MATVYSGKNGDIEASGNNNGQLYPGMMENPQIRWAFIRKVYALLCIQLGFTFGVSIFMFCYPPIRPFLTTLPGRIIFILAIVITFSTMLLMAFYNRKHPWNYILMLIFTMSMSFMIGVICTRKSDELDFWNLLVVLIPFGFHSIGGGDVVLEAAGLTALVTVGLTLYTFWAARKGYDFNFLGPSAFTLLRIFFPMGTVGQMIFGCVGALLFSGLIIYDTDNIIKRFSYDEYIIAASALFIQTSLISFLHF